MLQGEHSAILSTFIKLPFVIKIFVLSIFEWPFYTGIAVVQIHMKCSILQHFTWDFTVCQSTHLGVSSLQRVNADKDEQSMSTQVLKKWSHQI